MFDSLNNETLRAAHDATRQLDGNHRALGLDPVATNPGPLRTGITGEPGNRGTREPGHAGRRRYASLGMIPVEDNEKSAYQAARSVLTARYGHLHLTFTSASAATSGQHEASWAGGAVSAGTEPELLTLVLAAMGDCGGEGHLWVTVDANRDPACSDNALISQRLECVECPEQERVITLYHPWPTPAESMR